MTKENNSPSIILASASPRRVDLLKMLGIEFVASPSHVDESVPPNTAAEDAVLEIAERKAKHILNESTADDTVVIGADTTVVLGKEMLGKPETEKDAIEMLTRLSGSDHEVMTGIALLRRDKKQMVSRLNGLEISSVKFRDLIPEEIKAYVDTKEPMDKAGAYALQGLGSAFVEKINGCYTNIIGLPVPLTVKLLRDSGVSILNCP